MSYSIVFLHVRDGDMLGWDEITPTSFRVGVIPTMGLPIALEHRLSITIGSENVTVFRTILITRAARAAEI
jgi:hypothetical protein